MIAECQTLEDTRRLHEANRAAYQAQQPVQVVPPPHMARPAAPPPPAEVRSLAAAGIPPDIGVAALNAVIERNEQLVQHIARTQKRDALYVRTKAQELAHNSPTMRYEDVLDAIRRGAIRI